eukprot:767584-Hanusia_phi.AAC.4
MVERVSIVQPTRTLTLSLYVSTNVRFMLQQVDSGHPISLTRYHNFVSQITNREMINTTAFLSYTPRSDCCIPEAPIGLIPDVVTCVA